MPVRKPITPTPLLQDFYREKAWAHIAAREGVSPRIYSDPNGIPSMGAGYALAVEVDGPNAKNPGQSTKKYVLRNLKEIGATISGDPNHPYVFTTDEEKRLHAVVPLLNNQSLLSK